MEGQGMRFDEMPEAIAKRLQGLANAGTRSGGDSADTMTTGTETAKKNRTPFGNRFHAVMAQAGYGGAQQIVDALAKAKQSFTYKQVYYLYGANYSSLSDADDTVPLLKACADLANVTIDSFFTDESTTKANSHAVDQELIGMVSKALTGPKAEFLTDAIEMAYAAAVTSKVHPRRHS
jgi:hypothetical protein